jgi:uncharacterized 2Fe-2S/4Fe-4S cluster protein (DUF4445 family)
MNVVTASRLRAEQKSLINSHGRRLVTVDIGTTTIAMRLYDESGKTVDEYVAVNPQTAYGADVISRIQAASGDLKKAAAMKTDVRSVLRKGYERFKNRLSNQETEESLFCVLAANTTMVYLLMGQDGGYDTAELGHAPFKANHLESIHTEIEGVETVVFPGLSAFVGGDIVSGIYACGMTEKDEITLFIDLGTNGEMAIGNRDRIVAAATAAGPAFEGGVNKGVWGSDMVAFLSELKNRGIMDETGLLTDEYFDKGIVIGNVRVTQQSVRAVQLAKAAIAAGIKILMREYGVEYSDIDRVVLAGGFGYYLSPVSAANIGLLPAADRALSGGNTSLLGAYMMGAEIIGEDSPEIPDISGIFKCKIDIINLAEVDGFNEVYINEMNF